MTKPILDCPGVVAGVRQRVAAAVAKHMRMDQEVEAGALADALDQAINCVRRERPAALRKAAERTIPCLRRRIGSFACTITAREARNYQPQPQRQPLKKHPQPPHRQPPQPLKPPAGASAAAA
jgi:hypothetical protein